MTERTTRLLASLLGLALIAGCAGEEEAPPAAGKPAIVTPVDVRDLEERIEATGELLAKQQAEVAAQVAGEITEILIDEGEAVEAGAVVLEIDPERRNLELDRTRARVEEARAALAEARRSLARTRSLAGQTFASKSQLDEAETAVATARARLHASEADLGVAARALRDASVTARFPGLIARRHVSRGEFVAVGQPLFELVSLDPIEVEFHLPEADSARVRVGIPVEVLVAPYPDEVFDATVTVISPTIDPRSRTLRVKALMQNRDGRLRPGLFARVDLGIAQRRGVLMVPEEAVLRRADGAVVFRLLEGHRVQRLVVETGVLRDGFIEIVDGLAPDDRIVSRGHAELIDGSKIVARNADGTLAVSSGPRAAAETGSEVLAP